MRRNILLLVGALLLIAGIAIVSVSRSPGEVANAASPGPSIVFGAPSFSGGTVQIPVLTSGSGFSPYAGLNLHVRWNPTLFSFASATNAGGLFGSGGFCPPADSHTFDPDGGGVLYSCTTLGGPISGTGLVAVISITPLATGCSPIHLFTLGPPDNGNDSTGTYTVDATDFTSQVTPYGADIGVNQAGAPCVPAGSPTVTPTITQTATPTVTPTATVSPTPTTPPVSGAPDVTVAAASVPPGLDSGAMVAYSATASNIGDAAATGVVVDFALPPGAVPFKNATCKVYVAGHFSCKLPNLAANDHAPGGADESSVILNVQVPITTPGIVINVLVHVSATNEPLANTGNNSAVVITNVRGCPDLTGDNVINILDFAKGALSYGLHVGQPGYNPLADLNGDNVVTIADFSIMATRYGNSCRGLDSDHDGLSDHDEVNLYHTDPFMADADGDGLPDGVEVLTYGSNPMIADTSGDSYADGEKAALGTDPTNYCLTMASDLNKDHVDNILDFAVASLSYKIASGNPGFNPNADLNRDGIVNILDLSLMAVNYGKSVLLCPLYPASARDRSARVVTFPTLADCDKPPGLPHPRREIWTGRRGYDAAHFRSRHQFGDGCVRGGRLFVGLQDERCDADSPCRESGSRDGDRLRNAGLCFDGECLEWRARREHPGRRAGEHSWCRAARQSGGSGRNGQHTGIGGDAWLRGVSGAWFDTCSG